MIKLVIFSSLLAAWIVTHVENEEGTTAWQRTISCMLSTPTVEKAKLAIKQKETQMENLARSTLGADHD